MRAAHRFPSHDVLARFFRMRRTERIPVPLLVELLGAPAARVRALLEPQSVTNVRWSDAATLLFDAWPRTRIIDALGAELAAGIPALWHPAPVTWQIPPFIVNALERQISAATIDDYVADVLYSEIDEGTVAILTADQAFREAFAYPDAPPVLKG
jgi:hypothetical protein